MEVTRLRAGPAAASPSGDYTPQIRRTFVQNCVQSAGEHHRLCACVYRRIKHEIPFQSFWVWDSRAARGGALPNKVNTFVAQCS